MAVSASSDPARRSARGDGLPLIHVRRAGDRQTLTRIAILAALFLIGVYTLFAAQRLQHAPPAATTLATRVEALGMRLQGRMELLEAALAAGEAVAAQAPATPIAAAEAVREVGGPAVTGAAVARGDVVIAEAGRLAGPIGRPSPARRWPRGGTPGSARPPPRILTSTSWSFPGPAPAAGC